MKRAEKHQLLADHYLEFFSVAMGILRDEEDARDAVQAALVDTMSKVMVNDVVSYCARAVRNKCLSTLKRKQAYVSISNVKLVTDIEQERLVQIVREKKQELSKVARSVVELHDEDGYTINEVAGMMRMSVSSVKRVLADAHYELRKKLKNEI